MIINTWLIVLRVLALKPQMRLKRSSVFRHAFLQARSICNLCNGIIFEAFSIKWFMANHNLGINSDMIRWGLNLVFVTKRWLNSQPTRVGYSHDDSLYSLTWKWLRRSLSVRRYEKIRCSIWWWYFKSVILFGCTLSKFRLADLYLLPFWESIHCISSLPKLNFLYLLLKIESWYAWLKSGHFKILDLGNHHSSLLSNHNP